MSAYECTHACYWILKRVGFRGGAEEVVCNKGAFYYFGDAGVQGGIKL